MTNQHPWINGDHLVICDSCGAQRYRSQCDFTWDGYLMCHILHCWYEKPVLFEIPPVINDPQPIYDVRPDITADNITMVADNASVGMWTLIGSTGKTLGSTGYRIGQVDASPNYWDV